MFEFGEPSHPAESQDSVQYFDEQRLLGRYETTSGEHAFVRWTITTVVPEVPGFSSAISDRSIVETVFVDPDDAAVAELAVYAAHPGQSIAGLFQQRGIPFRYPHQPVEPVVRLMPSAPSTERVPVTDEDVPEAIAGGQATRNPLKRPSRLHIVRAIAIIATGLRQLWPNTDATEA
jgi:hypothetical protein